MAFKLTLQVHGNLIYYPLTCCHSICPFRHLFINEFNQDFLSANCVLGPEFKVGTIISSHIFLEQDNIDV